jgi:hypothetical protein
MVFRHYQAFLGMNFSSENQEHFQNATMYQKQAILTLKQSQDLDGYLAFLNMAYNEYQDIRR